MHRFIDYQHIQIGTTLTDVARVNYVCNCVSDQTHTGNESAVKLILASKSQLTKIKFMSLLIPIGGIDWNLSKRQKTHDRPVKVYIITSSLVMV